jgi:hypothetical protein
MTIFKTGITFTFTPTIWALLYFTAPNVMHTPFHLTKYQAITQWQKMKYIKIF